MITKQSISQDLLSLKNIDEKGYWISPTDNVPMAFVTVGTFFMGSEADDAYQDEKPVHEVYLEPFLIDIHKVKVESYERFLYDVREHGGHHCDWCHPEEPAEKTHIPDFWNKQLKNPIQTVYGVDWYDAWAYARWAGKSIPTEAQWEKSGQRQFIFSLLNKIDSEQLPGIFIKGWEWCLDWYDKSFYEKSPRLEPCCAKRAIYKVVKGSAYHATLPLKRNSFRNRYPLEHRDESLGFRCVKKIPNDFSLISH